MEVERGGGDRAFDGYGGGRVTGAKKPQQIDKKLASKPGVYLFPPRVAPSILLSH